MFAEDVDLLPDKLFERMLQASERRARRASPTMRRKLFAAMRAGGQVGFERVDWFNGGLFDDDTALPLTRRRHRHALRRRPPRLGEHRPSILGTLFERGLDPGKRSQLGAHYTDRDKIMLIVNPVIVEPLRAEWDEKRRPRSQERIEQPRTAATRKRRATHGPQRGARARDRGFLERLQAFRVLDPACGSGNFLYLALKALKDIEHRVNVEAEALGLPARLSARRPGGVKGIEINPYAAELARVSVWIGEIQWMRAQRLRCRRAIRS